MKILFLQTRQQENLAGVVGIIFYILLSQLLSGLPQHKIILLFFNQKILYTSKKILASPNKTERKSYPI